MNWKIKVLSLPYYLPIARERVVGWILFPKGICAMWNENTLVQDLISGHHVNFLP